MKNVAQYYFKMAGMHGVDQAMGYTLEMFEGLTKEQINHAIFQYDPRNEPSFLPREFTGCEEYRGYTIALRLGRYSVWNENGMCRGGFYATRADARSYIDSVHYLADTKGISNA